MGVNECTPELSRAVCPANEGIETSPLLSGNWPTRGAARSAPLMRGLKRRPDDRILAGFLCRAVCPANEGIETLLGDLCSCRLCGCRAVCPANEGIETALLLYADMLTEILGRAVCPANEGIETPKKRARRERETNAARSAPLMRGLKRRLARNFRFRSSTACRAVCPANEGIETRPAQSTPALEN